jgi:hypothetical protein
MADRDSAGRSRCGGSRLAAAFRIRGKSGGGGLLRGRAVAAPIVPVFRILALPAAGSRPRTGFLPKRHRRRPPL